MESKQPSSRAKRALVDELREVVGDEAVEQADLDIDRAVGAGRSGPSAEANRSRVMLAVASAVGLAVVVVIALALQSWWVLVPLLALHATVTFFVVRTQLRATTDVEKPAPTTQALLEEEGVSDPEGALNDLVEQTAEQTSDDSANDVTRQQKSLTPDSPTRRSRSV
jgi:hypothetical protein